jgi:hypothetical protein
VTGDDLMSAVQTLIEFDHRDQAHQAAAQLPEHLPVTDLLRAADGAQQLARALAELRRDSAHEVVDEPEHDPHDVRSLYS